MTRLVSEWISTIEKDVNDWNLKLKAMTGLDFVELSIKVAGVSKEEFILKAKTTKVAVIPVTSGLGLISSFPESVKAIASCMGFETYITEATDVNGIYEAHCKGTDIIIMADDHRYLALNLKKNKSGDNNFATANGYVELLDSFSGGINGKDVLVLGYGIIGQLMAEAAKKKNAKVTVYDKDSVASDKAEIEGWNTIQDIKEMAKYEYILDGTSQGSWMKKEYLHKDVKICTPGVPLSLDEELKKIYEEKLIHDYLEIGTAVMLGLAL